MKTLFPLLILLVFGCGRPPDSQLDADEKELAAVYAKLVLLQEKLPVEHPAYPDSMQAILNRHGMTHEKYDLILASLDRTQERWVAFYREVLKVLDASPPPPVASGDRSRETPVKQPGIPAPGGAGPGARPVPRIPSEDRSERP